jgi:hypothetical protein
MTKLLVGECLNDDIFEVLDPDALNEIEVEHATVRALSCNYRSHFCFVFTGRFKHNGRGIA